MGDPPAARRTVPLIRFLARAGVRVALRAQVPAIALTFGAAGLLGREFVRSLAATLFPSSGGLGAHGALLALLFLCSALAARRRVGAGVQGALRSMPASGDDWRRAIWVGTAVAGLPLLIASGILLAVAVAFPRDPPSAGRAAEAALWLPTLGLTSAALASSRPARSPRAASLAAAAWGLAVTGTWLALGAASGALLLWDRVAGRLESQPRAPIASRRRFFPIGDRRSVAGILAAITYRSLGVRLLAPWLAGMLALGAGRLFVSNNELSAHHVAGAERLAVLSALGLSAAILVDLLGIRRSPWAWARSLPWSARRRALLEAGQLAILLSPLLALSLWLSPRGTLAALLVLPFVTLRAATHLAVPARLSPGARTVLETLPVAAACALLPPISLLVLLLVPWWLLLAAAADRRSPVSAWRELSYSSQGDPSLSSQP